MSSKSTTRRRLTKAQHGFLVTVGRLKVHVLIYRTLADMRRAGVESDRKWKNDAKTSLAWSRAMRMRHKKTNRLSPIFAAIGFAAEDLRPRYVVHEAFHTALRWGARVGYQYLALPQPIEERSHDFTAEERIAETCDEICRQIFLKLYDLKVWT